MSMECCHPEKGISETRTQYGILIAIMTVLIAVVAVFDRWDDVTYYWTAISNITDNHLMPYSECMFEYPPLTLILLYIPKIFSPNVEVYHFAYVLFAAISTLVFYHYLLKITEYFGYSKKIAFGFMLMLVLSSNIFLLCRYDIFTVTIIIISVWKYIQKKYRWAVIIMAIAAMVKLYPALFIAIMMIPMINQRDWRRLGETILISLGIVLLVELPFLIDNAGTAFAYLSYHSDRGIQVESTIASIILVAHIFVPFELNVVYNYGSHNLAGPLADAIAPHMNMFLGLCIGLFLVFALALAIRKKMGERKTMEFVITSMTITTMLFVLCNKVYSTQYLIWIVALIPITYYLAAEQHRELILRLTIFACIINLVASFTYFELIELNALAILVELVKNVMDIALLVIIFKTMVQDVGTSEPTQS